MFDFSLFFNAFLTDFGPPDGTPKSSQNLSKIRLGRPKAPQGRQRPPRSLQGAILKPPGSHFGAFLDYFWSHFDAKIAPQTSTSIQNHFLASLPFPPAAIFEPPDLIFSYFRTSGAHFQAPWPVWGAAHWRSGHRAEVGSWEAVRSSGEHEVVEA